MIVYGRLKTQKEVELSALKVVAVTYERWSVRRGSKGSDLTWKLLISEKLVAEERWSQGSTVLQFSRACLNTTLTVFIFSLRAT